MAGTIEILVKSTSKLYPYCGFCHIYLYFSAKVGIKLFSVLPHEGLCVNLSTLHFEIITKMKKNGLVVNYCCMCITINELLHKLVA